MEFLVLETNKHFPKFRKGLWKCCSLEKVYGNAAIGYSAVKKWVSRIKSEEEEEDPSLSDLRDKSRSGRPSSAVNPGNCARAEELIADDRRVTVDDIAERLGISHGNTAKIVGV